MKRWVSDRAATLILEKFERCEGRDGGGGGLLGVAMLGSGCRVGRPLGGRGRTGAGQGQGVHGGDDDVGSMSSGASTTTTTIAVVGAADSVGRDWLPMWAM